MCDGCPTKVQIWANNQLPVSVAVRAGWDRASSGHPICLNKQTVIELLKIGGSEDVFDDMDRVAICEEELLRIYGENMEQTK